MKFHIQGRPTSPHAAWSLVGDTDLLGRLADSPSLVPRVVLGDDGYPEMHGEMVGPGPVRHTFTEPAARWVRGASYELIREVRGPLLRRTHYRARIEPGPTPDSVVPVIDFEAHGTNRLTDTVVGTVVRRTEAAWRKALSQLPAPTATASLPSWRTLPEVVAHTLQRWARRSEHSADVVHHLAHTLQHIRPAELTRLRPHALADRWNLDRNIVLEAFLEGIDSGAVELVYLSRCPRCTGTLSTADTLSDLADHAHCDSCRIGFTPDLGRDVEVVFAAHPALRPRAEQYCTRYPAGRPEVAAFLTLSPKSEEQLTVPLTPGRWLLGSGGEAPDVLVEVHPDSAQRAVEWSPDTHTVCRVGAGDIALKLRNPTAGRLLVSLARHPDDGGEPIVTAARLATFPAHRRRFGPQTLAPNVRLTVRAVALLFTDLVGSAALYSTHGDAQAFSLVHAHFTLLDDVVSEYDGVRVKTIGDALMAAFIEPAQALRAAVEAQHRFSAWARSLEMDSPPGLRVGLHWGPALAVHTDQAGLDYFGGTVNLAARCEGVAQQGEVVLTQALADAPGVAAVLAEHGPSAPFDRAVKGIAGQVAMVRLQPGLSGPTSDPASAS